MRNITLGLATLILAALPVFGDVPGKKAKPAVPLFVGLGDHSRKIATSGRTAQRYFDQGLMFMFAFNHDEAVRAFQKATEIDSACAMANWGIALASGMNYNKPDFPAESAKLASDSLAKARANADRESPANRALIECLSARYPEPVPAERADAEKAYSDAMKGVWEKFPDDADIGALYAESMMNLRPWDLWTTDGKPQPITPVILSTLEAVRKIAPDHALANHLYIHAVEASPHPGRADDAAHHLRGKHPALGHLLHMPSHIDIRCGRWNEAVEANILAIDADGKYQKRNPEQGYYRLYMAHNFHMATFAAMMQGQSGLALKTIRAMLADVPASWLEVEGNAAIADGFAAMPLEVMKRFGRWDDILKEPEPPAIFPIARAMRLYSRGVAYAAKGQVDEARKEQEVFRDAMKRIDPKARFSNNTAGDLLAIADLTLEGEIQFRQGKRKEAIATLRMAVAREDQLRYAEPPDWFVPVRHALGAVLLRDGQATAAEVVYREDLRHWPDNGWSLHGLAASLEAQGKKDDAVMAKFQFAEVWKRADVKIPSSCFCVTDYR